MRWDSLKMHATVVREVDFKASARRHFADAELLARHDRTANAGQLYGFTALTLRSRSAKALEFGVCSL
jgi:predicted deacetylase